MSNEKKDDRLANAIADLPREKTPPRDLWPDIEAQIQRSRPAIGGRRWSRRRVVLQAVAALFFMAVGAGGARLFWSPSEVPLEATERTSYRTVSLSSEIETEYLVAKQELWLLALTRLDELPPETRKVVAANLRIIDRALRDLRKAMEADPYDPQLRELLLSTHQKELKLLQRLATSNA